MRCSHVYKRGDKTGQQCTINPKNTENKYCSRHNPLVMKQNLLLLNSLKDRDEIVAASRAKYVAKTKVVGSRAWAMRRKAFIKRIAMHESIKNARRLNEDTKKHGWDFSEVIDEVEKLSA
jgi:hypothetical protein